ncbi:hypothetical protein EDD90_2837 [Streptomyces sp. Ag109_O5-1]|uniref:hypothetical protein n=1 Tax=Streptomyces sp. Ag109_O5-1 TaxID=1938851 RepID=UPI000F4EA1D4|nr:hypothetical protein [Streptomyces sp. Ag109_O5-1]RPE39819.1 hypothetical protein EDD90_2837 [Streptomyces sp. Ag109_O5-1]
MTSTIAPPAGRRRITRVELTDAQVRFSIDFVLVRLGTAYGLTEDTPAVPYADRAERLSLSTIAAWQLGLALTPGCELAQCYDCADLVDGALTEEDAGVIRCDHCHGDHHAGAQHEADPYDLWRDFYRA